MSGIADMLSMLEEGKFRGHKNPVPKFQPFSASGPKSTLFRKLVGLLEYSQTRFVNEVPSMLSTYHNLQRVLKIFMETKVI